jgi:ABC-2 type transport system permease protein
MKIIKMVHDSLTSIFNVLFPGNTFAVNALSKSNPFGMLIFLLITAAAMVVFLLVARALYFKGVTGIMDASSSRKTIGKESMERIAQKKSVLLTYTSKEIKFLLRTPIYFLNCVVVNFLWSILFIFVTFSAGRDAEFAAMLQFIKFNSPGTLAIFYGIACAVGFFVGSFNMIASTAISRDGANFFFVKYIPVSYRTQINAKALCGIFFSVLGMITLYAAACYTLRIPIIPLLISIPFCVLGILLVSYLGLIVDLARPSLVWDNEQKAVKQNLNTVILMGIAAILAAVVVIGTIVFSGAGPFITGIVEIAVLGLALYGVYNWCMSFAPKAIRRLS